MDWLNLLIYIGTHSYNFVNKYGYFGLFVVSMISTASIFMPFPNFILTFAFGAVLNPFMVAVITALGSSIGETTSYIFGFGSKKVLERKYKNGIQRMKKIFQKYGPDFWIIFVAATPLPDSAIGIFCGLVRYNFKRYFLDVFIGKFILSLILAYAGFYSLHWVLDFFWARLGS
jgi:membrane protein YqaA with SNARE-associated domain